MRPDDLHKMLWQTIADRAKRDYGLVSDERKERAIEAMCLPQDIEIALRNNAFCAACVARERLQMTQCPMRWTWWDENVECQGEGHQIPCMAPDSFYTQWSRSGSMSEQRKLALLIAFNLPWRSHVLQRLSPL